MAYREQHQCGSEGTRQASSIASAEASVTALRRISRPRLNSRSSQPSGHLTSARRSDGRRNGRSNAMFSWSGTSWRAWPSTRELSLATIAELSSRGFSLVAVTAVREVQRAAVYTDELDARKCNPPRIAEEKGPRDVFPLLPSTPSPSINVSRRCVTSSARIVVPVSIGCSTTLLRTSSSHGDGGDNRGQG